MQDLKDLTYKELEKIADDESLPQDFLLKAWAEILNRLDAFYG